MAQSFSQLFTGIATRNEKETMQLLNSVQQNVMQLQQIKQQKRDKYADVVANYDPDIVSDVQKEIFGDRTDIDLSAGNYSNEDMAMFANRINERTEVRNAYRNFKTQANLTVMKELGLQEDYEPKTPDEYDETVEKYKSQAVKSGIIENIYKIPDSEVRKKYVEVAKKMEINEESVNDMMASINAEIDKLNDKDALKKAVEKLSAEVTPEIFKKFDIGNITTKERFIEVMQELNKMDAEAKEVEKTRTPTKSERDANEMLDKYGIDYSRMTSMEKTKLAKQIKDLPELEATNKRIMDRLKRLKESNQNFDFNLDDNSYSIKIKTGILGWGKGKTVTNDLRTYLENRDFSKSEIDDFMEYQRLIKEYPQLKDPVGLFESE